MTTQRIDIIMNGVTGRMGTNQHLARSIAAIIKQGGVQVSPELTLMPDPILTGRNENKLRPLAEQYGNEAQGTPFSFFWRHVKKVKKKVKVCCLSLWFLASGTPPTSYLLPKERDVTDEKRREYQSEEEEKKLNGTRRA